MSGYTTLRAADVRDATGNAPGAYLAYGRQLKAGQLGFNLRVLAPRTTHLPPGMDPTSGHSHRTIEEIYFVISGELTIKLDDDVITLGPRDAICISPDTVRTVRNDSDEEAVVVMCSQKVDDPATESQWHEGFWPRG